ncbi:CPBP family intramembrane metalloprotease [Leifsonia sp. H3M29-4]|uniref:CPBP family glutamic-type intramembrane protease n=1 Tax=Salinibacterium metalliresistens TaxID=3031321 RepID=UPI0023DAF85B|nr:CPBP family glutamic-type intramembrane protease [Salinibacterium metalliresistens]MDF1477597.1 CPBP family intramembrane metalloprotease [Salinibacterium metalliresistens]
MPADETIDAPPRPAWSWSLVPAVLLSASALFLFAWRGTSVASTLVGYGMLVVALVVAWAFDRRALSEGLFRDLLLIAVGMAIVSTISVEADIGWTNFFLLGVVLAAAVAVPYLISRFVFKDRIIRFRWRGGWPWTPVQWGYLALVLFLGWLILPFYFISSGVYLNWPAVTEWHEIGRLFIGVNAVGTWDELFFIITVFVLFKRHFPTWQANLLQAIIFVSFLWELGYQSWGPLLTIPFALLQGWIYSQTKSLVYVLTVHLLFDAVVFLVIVHARNDGVIPFFLISP